MRPRTGVRALALAAALSAALVTSAVAPSLAAALPGPARCPVPGCWHPALRTSWQIQFTGRLDRSVHAHLYEVDMFDTSRATVRALHRTGRKVACYVDAGTWERWRPDASRFPPSTLGKRNGWPGERWLDIRRIHVLAPIMRARLDSCARKGFDGVELDNVDGYANRTGFPLTGADQLAYNVFLANAAHRRGLAVALKNDLDQIPRLVRYFDWSLDEQCFQYSECRKLLPFIRAGKPVMEIEYRLDPGAFCPRANRYGFNALRKHLSLDAYRVACR